MGMDDQKKEEIFKKRVVGVMGFLILATIILGIVALVKLVQWKFLPNGDECSKFAGMEGNLPPCLTQDDLDKRRDAFIGCGAAAIVSAVGAYICFKVSE